MSNGDLNWIANFLWGIADSVLHHVFVRSKYRDVILPMTVIRRLDTVLEPTKKDVLNAKKRLDKAGVAHQDKPLRSAAGQAFYNTSPFTLRDLASCTSQQQLKSDFEAYLDGFSPNVQEIIENFKFRNQIPDLAKADKLGSLIEQFLDPQINLGPSPVYNGDGSVKLPGLDNHAMGTIFEELVRRFNEDNNEDAGEHWTPRDAVKLMAKLIFVPIADKIESGTYLLYDGACGTGGMLTVADEELQRLAKEHKKKVVTHLYGQEVNPETYAIAKADLLITGDGEAADNIVGGTDKSTLSNDAFSAMEFDFMLSNPPYGTDWKDDLERMGGKDGIKDPRFIIEHAGDPEFRLITRSSDGQMLFLANMMSKMKTKTKLGSRIAEVHNGSSLFTGDAGQGESNARRWIIENDWLESIIALPLHMFYNTGIATYIWVLSNRKSLNRRGKVQLIDATQWFKPLRKNLGDKNCELSDEEIAKILKTFMTFKETEQSKIFPNAEFGYWKIAVERPLRLRVNLNKEALSAFRASCVEEKELDLAKLIDSAAKKLGNGPHSNFNNFMAKIEPLADEAGVKLSPKRIKLIQSTLAEKDESAEPVVSKVHNPSKVKADPMHGFFEVTINGKKQTVEYETDTEMRDSEQVPLLEKGGIETFIQRDVLPYAPDAWVDASSTKIGYEISFNRYFYKPQQLRPLAEISADILAIEKETEGLLGEIITGAGK